MQARPQTRLPERDRNRAQRAPIARARREDRRYSARAARGIRPARQRWDRAELPSCRPYVVAPHRRRGRLARRLAETETTIHPLEVGGGRHLPPLTLPTFTMSFFDFVVSILKPTSFLPFRALRIRENSIALIMARPPCCSFVDMATRLHCPVSRA